MSGGDGTLHVNPGDLHRHASQRRVEAADFLTDKPPPVPGDPDDPTTGATGDLQGDVHGVNQHLHDKSNKTADKVDADGHAYSTQNEDATAQVGSVGGQGKQGLGDALKLGDVTTPLGTVFGQLLSSLGTLAGQTTSATATFGGQALGAGSNLIAKNMGVASAAPGVTPGIGAGMGAGGGAPGDDKDKGQTKPASATSPLQPQSGAPSSLHNGDYARPEDRDEHVVQSTGMGSSGMGGMAGMGAAGGSPTSGSKPRMYRIHDPHDPPTEPIPVIITEVAYAASPLKESHGTDT